MVRRCKITMLGDEEKKAIETIKDFKNLKWYEPAFDNGTEVLDEEQKQDIEIVLNLIEKQSKEIEELKEKNRQGKMRIVQLENEITARIEDVNQYYTPNDKIKAKIEEINKEMLNEENSLELFYRKKYCKDVLQSLLEKE